MNTNTRKEDDMNHEFKQADLWPHLFALECEAAFIAQVTFREEPS